MGNVKINSFNCPKCGRKIRTSIAHSNKKGICPKCKAVIIIPEMSDEIALKSYNCNTESSKYKRQTPEPELHLKREISTPKQFDGLSADGLIVTNETFLKSEITEKLPERKLSGFLDIFLYPTSMSGLINIGIFCALSLLLGIFSILTGLFFIRSAFLFIGFSILAYMLYYIIGCIRDSALGGIRAPDNFSSLPTSSEALSQLWDIVISAILLWGPVSGYYTYKILTQPTNPDLPYNAGMDVIYWLLLGYGVFFSPMGLLALAIFNSSSAYNPLVWITSIFSTCFQYLGLVFLFAILAFLVSRITAYLQGGFLNALLFIVVFLYLAMVAAHLLGRFYYLNSKKLNWEA